MPLENPITEEQYQYALSMIQYHESKLDKYKAISQKYHREHEIRRIVQRNNTIHMYQPLYKYNVKLPIPNTQ